MRLLNQKNWCEQELLIFEYITEYLPAAHVKKNRHIQGVIRKDYFHNQGMPLDCVAGTYQTNSKIITIYDPAFLEALDFDCIKIPSADFSVLNLIGHSLFQNAQFQSAWSELYHLEFCLHEQEQNEIRFIDKNLVHDILQFRSYHLTFNRYLTSLEQSFSLAYACYVLVPQQLMNAYPKAYQFFRKSLFGNQEFRENITIQSGSKYWVQI